MRDTGMVELKHITSQREKENGALLSYYLLREGKTSMAGWGSSSQSVEELKQMIEIIILNRPRVLWQNKQGRDDRLSRDLGIHFKCNKERFCNSEKSVLLRTARRSQLWKTVPTGKEWMNGRKKEHDRQIIDVVEVSCRSCLFWWIEWGTSTR